jgi:uncharacterized protein (TIRG00374 family)
MAANPIVMKKLQLTLLGLGIVFLAVLVAHVGLHKLWDQLAMLGWGLIPLMLGEGVAEMIHTLGWRHCLSGPLRSLSWWTLFRIRMAGYAINYLTPTAALGGEVTKGTLLAARHRGPEAASGVLIGKLCFALAHLLFVVLGGGLVLWRVKIPAAWWSAMLASGAVMAGGMIAFLLLQKYGRLGGLVRWLAAREVGGRMLHRAADGLTAVDETMKQFYRERPFGLPLAIGWHLVGYSVGIAQTWLFFHLLHQDANWTVAAGIWFLGMWFDLLTFAVPQNIGTLEGTRAVILVIFGYTPVMGVAYGVALRLAQLIWSCFGLVVYIPEIASLKAPQIMAPPSTPPGPRAGLSPAPARASSLDQHSPLGRHEKI